MAQVEIKHLTKEFQKGVKVIDGLNLAIND